MAVAPPGVYNHGVAEAAAHARLRCGGAASSCAILAITRPPPDDDEGEPLLISATMAGPPRARAPAAVMVGARHNARITRHAVASNSYGFAAPAGRAQVVQRSPTAQRGKCRVRHADTSIRQEPPCTARKMPMIGICARYVTHTPRRKRAVYCYPRFGEAPKPYMSPLLFKEDDYTIQRQQDTTEPAAATACQAAACTKCQCQGHAVVSCIMTFAVCLTVTVIHDECRLARKTKPSCTNVYVYLFQEDELWIVIA